MFIKAYGDNQKYAIAFITVKPSSVLVYALFLNIKPPMQKPIIVGTTQANPYPLRGIAAYKLSRAVKLKLINPMAFIMAYES